MEKDKKNVMKLISIIVIYILLSTLGVFEQIGVVLFPIIAIPFTLFCMRNKVAKELHIFFHVIVSIVIYLMTSSVLGILIYIVSVIVPTYIILFLYKQKLPLPNIIMYGGLILAGIIFVYFAIMKGLGFDFEAQFGAGMDALITEFSTTLDSVAHMGTSTGMSMAELQASTNQMKEIVANSIGILKTLYATIVVSQTVMCFAITVIIVNIIARRKVSELPPTRQILEFRVSRIAILLLVFSMLLTDMYMNSSGAMIVFAYNLMSFLASLFEIVGMLSLIELLRRTSIGSVVKVLGYIGIVILFMTYPYMLILFGCIDTLFNWRKVSIVV